VRGGRRFILIDLGLIVLGGAVLAAELAADGTSKPWFLALAAMLV